MLKPRLCNRDDAGWLVGCCGRLAWVPAGKSETGGWLACLRARVKQEVYGRLAGVPAGKSETGGWLACLRARVKREAGWRACGQE